MTARLFCSETSSTASASPVVFLHGFGGQAAQWQAMQKAISPHAPSLAFDLPGHAQSLDYPGFGPPKIAANAVIDEINARGLEKVHLVGHSMGGAVSCLVALFAPHLVASLTLLAPGGFGPEINMDQLSIWAQARTEDELSTVMASFFAPGFELPDKALELNHQARQRAGANDALIAIAGTMTRDGKQGQLPLDALLALDIPISLVWGDRDEILPVSHALPLKNRVNLHILPGIGHSPAEEVFDQVRDIIIANVTR